MATQTAKNATNDTFTFELPLAPGRAAAAASRPVAIDGETKAVLDAAATSAKQDTLLTEMQSVHKAEDAVHSTGDKGVMALVVRKDTAAALAGADGDYAPLEVDASGRLWVNVGAIQAGSNAIGSITNTGFTATGTVAHDAVDSGNPIKVGGKAFSGAPGAVADGDRVDQAMTVRGGAHTVLVRSDGTVVDPDSPAIVDSGVRYVDVTLSVDTSAYASGDLIADAQIVAACVRSNDATGMLASVLVIDEDDQGAAFTVYFANASASWGTENSAPTITDANARTILGYVDIATGDYKDLGGVKVAFKANANVSITPATGTDDIYVAVVNGSGTPTYTASGLKLRLGFLI